MTGVRAGASLSRANQRIVISDDVQLHRAIDLQSLLSLSVEGGGHASRALTVETPVEALDDAWAVLRALRPLLRDGGRLTVHSSTSHGHALRSQHVDSLLRLSGFVPLARKRSPNAVTTVGEKAPLARMDLSCSVVVPCRNEEDNVEVLARRLPAMGRRTELIFVDDASTDRTVERIEKLIIGRSERDIRLLRQTEPGGKAGAVFQGFNAATGDVLVILDADMTVAPEDLPRFFLALAEGVADFANGTRFAYPMEAGAMPGFNNLGNRAFIVLFSWLLGVRVTDTLCGTKALFRRDWPAIDEARSLFGGHDPWGDFDLLLGARYRGLRLVDVPVRYGARMAGESKMRPFRHGAVLTRTCAEAIRHLKLSPDLRRGRGG